MNLLGENDNCFRVVQVFLLRLKVKISKNSLKEKLYYHENYPSMSSLHETFESFGIPSLPVVISSDQLSEIPLPAIAHINKQGHGEFIILDRFEQGLVTYEYDKNKSHVISLEEFKKYWKGVVLLANPDENSGETNFWSQRKKELIQKTILWVFIATLLFSLVKLMTITTPLLALSLTIKLMAIGIVYLIVSKQFHLNTKAFSNLCQVKGNDDCQEIITSERSKILGIYYLWEGALVYFFSGLLSISIAAFASVSVTMLLWVVSIPACLLTLYTLYLQWHVLKKWCFLCLLLTSTIWLDSALLWFSSEFYISYSGISVVAFSFSIVSLVWLFLRDAVLFHFQAPTIKRKLNLFTRSSNVFKALLNQQYSVTESQMTYEFVMGDTAATTTLIIVISPTCSYCAQVFYELQQLSYNIKVIVRFSIGNNTSSISYLLPLHLANLRVNFSNERAIQALSGWFDQYESGNFDQWVKQYSTPLNKNEDEVGGLIKEHRSWSNKANITSTPILIYQNRKVPVEYSINDLIYHIKNDVSIKPND